MDHIVIIMTSPWCVRANCAEDFLSHEQLVFSSIVTRLETIADATNFFQYNFYIPRCRSIIPVERIGDGFHNKLPEAGEY